MGRVLCIEDNMEIQVLIKELLKPVDVLTCQSLLEGQKLIQDQTFDLLLLDLGLPDGDGMKLLSWIEASPHLKKIPLFILTAKNEIASKTQAFALGADDFITKPFDPQELKLRILAKMKKTSEQNKLNDTLKINDLNIFIATQKVYLSLPQGPQAIDLTAIEFRLLSILAKNPERIFTREDLLKMAWGDHVNITDRTVDTHIGNLRKKIKSSQVTIETVVNVGYKLKNRN